MSDLKQKKNKKNKYIDEDTTMYGEYVSSCFNWITLDEQKKKGKQLDKITNNKKKLKKSKNILTL